MKAIECTRYGPPEVLKLIHIPKPSPREDEVLIKVLFTSVTVADTRVRGFKVPAAFWLPARLTLGIFKPKQPILGGEVSGIIEEVGNKVKKFKSGDSVFVFTGHKMGAYVEYISIKENDCIALKPENLSFRQAVALSFGASTALHFLNKGHVSLGIKILIYGSTGSVGTYAVQLAKYYGAEVTAFCSTTNIELVASLGADRVIDYTKSKITDMHEYFDVVFDTVGKTKVKDAKKIIKPNGRYIHTVMTPITEIITRIKLMGSRIKLIGGTFETKPEQIDFIQKRASEGVLKPVIDKEYSFEEIARAHKYVDQGHKKGNVVIKVNEL